jgi:hypothetical protein
MAQTTVRLNELVRGDMERLQAALEAEEGLKATREDIVAALIHGRPLLSLLAC